MLAVAGAAYARMPKRRFQNIDNAKFEAMFPKAFGNWRTLPSSELIMPPEGDLTAKLYQHILTRTYVNGEGDARHAPGRLQQRTGEQRPGSPPGNLLRGQRLRHSSDSKPVRCPGRARVKVIPARLVRAERVTRTENIIYWTRIGDDFPQSWTQQRIAMTKANLEGFYADGLLVRASVGRQ